MHTIYNNYIRQQSYTANNGMIKLAIAMSLGHSQFFNVQCARLITWEWRGDNANPVLMNIMSGCYADALSYK